MKPRHPLAPYLVKLAATAADGELVTLRATVRALQMAEAADMGAAAVADECARRELSDPRPYNVIPETELRRRRR